MGWTFQERGSCNWNEVWEMTFVIVKGLYCLGASFAEGCDVVKFCASSQTLSPV